MSLSFGLSPWLLALCLVLAAGLTYWTYRRTTPPISRGWRWLLGGLRFVALALIFFLLFEPIVRQLSTTERPPVLAVLIDDSESLRAPPERIPPRPPPATLSVMPCAAWTRAICRARSATLPLAAGCVR